MNKTKQVIILTIIVVAAIAARAIPINPFGGSSAKADQGEKSGIQKWEYCAIVSAFYGKSNFGWGGKATIRYFQAGGGKEETVEVVPDIGKRDTRGITDDVLAKAIAKLGDEGWEMISKESDNDNGGFRPFYFKRLKQ